MTETGDVAYDKLREWAFKLSNLADDLYVESGRQPHAETLRSMCEEIASEAINIAVLVKMVYG